MYGNLAYTGGMKLVEWDWAGDSSGCMKTDFVLWARQYSKRLLTFIFCVWGVGAVIGAIYEILRLIVTPETASMDSYYLYLAVPMTCGVTSYLIANTLLNKEKVKQNYIYNYDNIVLGGEYENEDGIGNSGINWHSLQDQGNNEEV